MSILDYNQACRRTWRSRSFRTLLIVSRTGDIAKRIRCTQSPGRKNIRSLRRSMGPRRPAPSESAIGLVLRAEFVSVGKASGPYRDLHFKVFPCGTCNIPKCIVDFPVLGSMPSGLGHMVHHSVHAFEELGVSLPRLELQRRDKYLACGCRQPLHDERAKLNFREEFGDAIFPCYVQRGMSSASDRADGRGRRRPPSPPSGRSSAGPGDVGPSDPKEDFQLEALPGVLGLPGLWFLKIPRHDRPGDMDALSTLLGVMVALVCSRPSWRAVALRRIYVGSK